MNPNSGTIAYNNKIYTSLNIDQKRELRSKMGMVFQGSALFDSMTILENVMFPLRMFTKLSYKRNGSEGRCCFKKGKS